MSEPKLQDKPFQISKWKVWEAYERVKANKGAAGVDEQSITEFGADRDRNLYKIWNRMSSGSYFPPPVKAVEIPKAGGKGVRLPGVPTVEDRVAQTVARLYLEPRVEPVFHPDSYGYRPDWVIDLEIELRVFANGQYYGRFMMRPQPGSRPSLQARLVAVTLAEQAGRALAAGAPTASTG